MSRYRKTLSSACSTVTSKAKCWSTIITYHFLGYTKDKDGNLVIEPEEAKTVKRIFYSYLQGMTMKQIAESLKADGALTGGKKTNWHSSGIALILKNEKYMGDALLQKTYTVDFLTKKRVKNNGIMP